VGQTHSPAPCPGGGGQQLGARGLLQRGNLESCRLPAQGRGTEEQAATGLPRLGGAEREGRAARGRVLCHPLPQRCEGGRGRDAAAPPREGKRSPRPLRRGGVHAMALGCWSSHGTVPRAAVSSGELGGGKDEAVSQQSRSDAPSRICCSRRWQWLGTSPSSCRGDMAPAQTPGAIPGWSQAAADAAGDPQTLLPWGRCLRARATAGSAPQLQEPAASFKQTRMGSEVPKLRSSATFGGWRSPAGRGHRASDPFLGSSGRRHAEPKKTDVSPRTARQSPRSPPARARSGAGAEAICAFWEGVSPAEWRLPEPQARHPLHPGPAAREVCQSVLLWGLAGAFMTPRSARCAGTGRTSDETADGSGARCSLRLGSRARAHEPPRRETEAGCCWGGGGEKAGAEVARGRAAAALQTRLGDILRCRAPRRQAQLRQHPGPSGFSPKGAFSLPPPSSEPVSRGCRQIFLLQNKRGRGR